MEDTDASEDQFEKDAKLDHKLKVRKFQKEIMMSLMFKKNQFPNFCLSHHLYIT